MRSTDRDCQSFHQCASFVRQVVVFAFLDSSSVEQSFPASTVILNRLHHCLELWLGIEWLCHAFEEPADSQTSTLEYGV